MHSDRITEPTTKARAEHVFIVEHFPISRSHFACRLALYLNSSIILFRIARIDNISFNRTVP